MIRNPRKKIAVVSVALTFLLAACGGASGTASSGTASKNCTPAQNVKTLTGGKLTIAIANVPDYVEMTPQGPGGADGKILSQIADKLCLTIEPKTMAFAATVEAVKEGRVDVAAAGYARTQARSEVANMSAPTYLDPASIVSKQGFNSIDQLRDKTVGTILGYFWIPEMKAIWGDKTKIYPDQTSAYQDLKQGRVDAILDGYMGGLPQTRNSGLKVNAMQPTNEFPSSLQPFQNAFLTDPKNDELAKAIDAQLTTMHEDGSIANILSSLGADPTLANTGPPRFAQ